MELPFVKLIETCTGQYIYDVGTNSIIKVEKKTYSNLQRMMKTGADVSDDPVLKRLMERGYLSSKKIEKIEHPYTEWADDYLSNRIYEIILQVTQNCNFRCRYCTFSGDGRLDRKHSQKVMPWEVAKKAIDFVIERNKYCRKLTVAFYGGEPLLEYPLIKRCVEYVNERVRGKEIKYTITTNASCITEEMVRFFIENDFSLMLSIDGSKESHDKNRRFASDGSGTFDHVMKKLQMIYDMSPEFFSSMSINSVWDQENDLEKQSKYLTTHPLLSKLPASIVAVESDRINTSFQITEDNVIKSKYLELMNVMAALGCSKKEISSNGYSDLRKYAKFARKITPISGMPSSFHHSGPCVPGCSRLFVDIHGDFRPCEKVSGSSPVGIIGNVNNGIDIAKVKQLMNLGKLTEDECKNCWAMHFCEMCMVVADDNKCLSRDLKLRACTSTKIAALVDLKKHVIMKELGVRMEEIEDE